MEIVLSVLILSFALCSLFFFVYSKVREKKNTENADESLLIIHMQDKYSSEDVEFADLVNCLNEKGFFISEYFAVRRILFDETESEKYHSIFKKIEKLIQEEIKA